MSSGLTCLLLSSGPSCDSHFLRQVYRPVLSQKLGRGRSADFQHAPPSPCSTLLSRSLPLGFPPSVSPPGSVRPRAGTRVRLSSVRLLSAAFRPVSENRCFIYSVQFSGYVTEEGKSSSCYSIMTQRGKNSLPCNSDKPLLSDSCTREAVQRCTDGLNGRRHSACPPGSTRSREEPL